MNIQTLVYDASFDGLLTCVFTVYELKLDKVNICPQHQHQEQLFGAILEITTDKEKADRVWKKIKEKTKGIEAYKLYAAFLSELPQIENHLLTAMQYIINSKKQVGSDYSHSSILEISKIAKSVGREKHRMEAFVRFKLTKDGIYFANIEPDFNVLPLISKHFKNRYADQQWIIYDIKRKYGLYYDLNKVEIIHLDFAKNFDFTKTSSDVFAVEELEFQQLWKDYFKSTNIESRKNTRLHVQHVPKKYWKYLSEKNI